MEMRATRPTAFGGDDGDRGVGTEEEIFLFPLSLGQERIWFLNELAPESSLFNLNTLTIIKKDHHPHPNHSIICVPSFFEAY